ncbi:MAG: tetratricopeptide repeat protein [Bryobacterales bacterium]|nr:tetratricopeptide repeat protein [Bryobacteraceae bacterium]MDW8355376.1 tetratricopeptide repeat protein [Bryobacterales bacterium]
MVAGRSGRRLAGLLCLAGCLSGQPPDPALLRRYAEEGERALAQKRYAEAEAVYEKLARLDPQSAELRARLGVIYFQQAKFGQAATAFREALRRKPDLANADVFLAMCLAEMGRHKEALAGLERGFRHSADSALRRLSGLHLQRSLTALGRDDRAVEVALQLTRLYPEDPEVLYHAGRTFGHYAWLTMHKLSQVAPDSVWRFQAAGEAYHSQGLFDLAVAAFRRVIELDPARPGAHFRLGRALLERSRQPGALPSDLPDAVQAFQRELELDPTNGNAAYELAEIHRKAGDLGRARELFELALKSDGEFREAHLGLGRVLLAMGDPRTALSHLQKAAALDPNDAVCHFHLAQAHRALGDGTAAQKALAEFRRLRQERAEQEQAVMSMFSRRDISPQALDPAAQP